MISSRPSACSTRAPELWGWEGIVRQIEAVFVSALIAQRGQGQAASLLARWESA